ncbi:MAG: hypothetical protein C0595_00875 [Marinilabiliales bacterium]|nr:MAG: hypothetical protein C0595_00875 [Marinilabiliales bacterium]
MDDFKNINNTDNNSQTTPYIIRAVSFFIIFSSIVAILFFSYVLFFKGSIISESASFVENPILSISTYIIIELILFVSLIVGGILIYRMMKWGIILIPLALSLLLILNYWYYGHFDWVYLILFSVLLIILAFYIKKVR